MQVLELAPAANEGAAPATAYEAVSNVSSDQRPRLAARLCEAFMRGELSERERLVTEAIFTCLARDAEIEVRRTLAEHIKSFPLLPNSIARSLAEDIEAVAVPILRSSLALTDNDLIAIIASGDTAKQCAIAEREILSEEVSGALVDTRKKAVIETLLTNDGAEISEATYGNLLETFSNDPEIQELLAGRFTLPVEIRERLIHLVSDELQKRMVEEHAFSSDFADQLIQHGRERVLAASLTSVRTPQDIEAAAMRLYLNGELTPTLLLRVLSGGQLELFGAALATLARVSNGKAQQDLSQTGSDALRQIYDKAGLPRGLQKAYQIILERVLEDRRAAKTKFRPSLQDRISEDLVQAYHEVSPDGLESAIFQLGRLAAKG